MMLTQEQIAAFNELKSRGSLSPEQVSAFDELQNRQQETTPSVGADVSKSAGRGLAQGAVGLVTGPIDLGAMAAPALYNLYREKAQGLPPIDMPPSLSEFVYKKLGIEAKPETEAGEYAQSIAQFVPAFAGGGSGTLRTRLAQALKGSTAAGVGSEVAGDIAEGTPYEGIARAGGAIAAGPAAWATGKAISKATGTVKDVTAPFFKGGREKIVGNVLRKSAADADAAIAELKAAQEIVPGSVPTTAEAAKDYGLISLQKAVRNEAPNQAIMAERSAAQNEARQALLKEIGGTTEDISVMKKTRELTTGPMREEAFKLSKSVQSGFMDNMLDSVLQSPPGARQSVEGAIRWVRSRIGKETDPRRLYEIRKDINDAMQGKFSGDLADLKLAKSQLKDIKTALDDAIDQAAPGYKGYLEEYAAQSKPITQKELIQELGRRAELAAPDVSGKPILSQAKWKNALKQNRDVIYRDLTPKQINSLERIGADLDRGAALNSASIRSAGSDTFRNMSMANFLGGLLGKKMSTNPIAQTLGRPLSWAYKIPEEHVNMLLVDSMLDPKLAARLMEKATPKNIEKFAEMWKRHYEASSLGILAEEGRE